MYHLPFKVRVSPAFITPSVALLRVAEVEYGEEEEKVQKNGEMALPKKKHKNWFSMNSQVKSPYFRSRMGDLGGEEEPEPVWTVQYLAMWAVCSLAARVPSHTSFTSSSLAHSLPPDWVSSRMGVQRLHQVREVPPWDLCIGKSCIYGLVVHKSFLFQLFVFFFSSSSHIKLSLRCC